MPGTAQRINPGLWICGIEHVRETIPFPRMLYKIYPQRVPFPQLVVVGFATNP